MIDSRQFPPTTSTRPAAIPQQAVSQAGVKKLAGAADQSLQHPQAGPSQDILLTSATAEAASPSRALQAKFTPADPREDLELAAFKKPDERHYSAGDLAMYPDYPDEYLYDGGDRDYPYHYEGNLRAGLESEDAVVEFHDDKGHKVVKPTNRVAIYAPKFATVRTIMGAETDLNVDKAVGALANTPQVGLENSIAALDHVQRDRAGGIRMRERASDLDSDEIPITKQAAIPPVSHSKWVNTHEDLAFVRTGTFLQTEQARLASEIQAAVEWSRNEYPIITADVVGAQSIKSWSKAVGMDGVEDMSKPGELRIVKLADKQSAEPGDEITFTIRYDNMGDRELRNIRIIDNLTSRLEYVEGSAHSEREGKLVVADNQEGSLILTFEVAQPLKGHEGGAITFKTIVK